MPHTHNKWLILARHVTRRLIALGFLTIATQAQAVKLITGDEYAPWVDTQLDGKGIAVEMVREVFQLIGAETVLVDIKPWNRALFETQQGLYAATFPYVRTAEREQIFLYSSPMFTVRNALFSKGNTPAFRDVANLKNTKLCRPQGYAVEVVETLLARVQFELVQPISIGHCFRMLIRGRVDTVLTSEAVGLHETKSHEIKGQPIRMEVLPEIADEITLHLLAPKSDPASVALIQRFNAGLKLYETRGLRQKLFDRRLQGLPAQ